MAQRLDPQPVDIDGDFVAVARTTMQQLRQTETRTSNQMGEREQEREQQLQVLRRVLLQNPLLLAVLEDPEWQQSIRQAAVPVPSEEHCGVNSQVAQAIKPGDVLNVSYYKLPHKVVVETCSYSADNNKLAVRAIHYGRISLLQSVTVMREDFQLSCNGSSTWLHTFPNSVLYSSQESLSRAVSRLGEKQHKPSGNNAHTLAVWCQVRDSRNLDRVQVPLFDDKGAELHQLMPADHIELSIYSEVIHAVVASIESLDEANNRKLLTVVALSETLAQASRSGLRTFRRKVLSLSPTERVEKLQLEFSRNKMQKNAERFDNTCLCWNCSDLTALNFLATGMSAEPKAHSRFTIHVSELRSDQVISYQNGIHFVLRVDRPERNDQTYQLHTVQYAPLNLEVAPKTTEIRMLINLREAGKVQLVRHAEPDLQCPVLLNWKVMDAPLITLNAVEDLSLLQPGDAVCIQEVSAQYPLPPQMPGLHAIVKRTQTSGPECNGDLYVDVICFNTDNSGCVEIKRVPVNGCNFSKLNFNISRDVLATREEALRRAEARLGTGQYCITWNSSRDFARWCCINHKSNAPLHTGVVAKPADLATCPTMQQSTKLKLQHQTAECRVVREVRLIDVSTSHDCANILKLNIVEIDWRVKKVQIVKINDTSALHKVGRVVYDGEPVSASQAQLLSDTLRILLYVSLANASDYRLGCGVSDRDFCTWLRSLKQAGLVELPALLSADFVDDAGSAQDLEQVTDLYSLRPWDHVVIEKPQSPPLHMLVHEFDVESGVLCGYTYAPSPEHDPGRRLDMYMYFPPDKSPYPMHKVIRRTPVDGDASSELSSSLAAGFNFPDNAAAWVQLCILELESDLLMPPGDLSSLLKSMLKFAFRYASNEFADDGSLQTCQHVLASGGFANALMDNLRSDAATRRLYFIVRLIASMLGSP